MFEPLVLLHLPTSPSINAVLPLHPSLHLSTTTRCEYQRRLPGLAHGFLSQPFHPQPCPCPHLRHINASVKVCLHQNPMRRTSELQRCLAGTINTKAGAKQHNLQRKLGIPSTETESTLPMASALFQFVANGQLMLRFCIFHLVHSDCSTTISSRPLRFCFSQCIKTPRVLSLVPRCRRSRKFLLLVRGYPDLQASGPHNQSNHHAHAGASCRSHLGIVKIGGRRVRPPQNNMEKVWGAGIVVGSFT